MIYEVTVRVESHRNGDWVMWIHPHVSRVLSTGCFHKATVEQALTNEPADIYEYVIRYSFCHLNDFYRYERDHAAAMRLEGIQFFGNAISATRRLLKQIS